MAITDFGVKGILHLALQDTPQSDKLAELALQVDSQLPSGSAEKLDFIGMVPALREWVGARKSKQPIEYNYTVTLQKFESTIQIPLDWVNNDKTGNVKSSAAGLARRYNPQWRAKRVAVLINASETDTCFDGKSFFATDHAWGESGTLDNDITFNASTHTAPTVYEAAQAVVKAVNQFASFKDDQGEPINEGMSKVTIVVQAGTNLAAALAQAISLPTVDTGTGVITNPVKGLGVQLELVASTRITLVDKFAAVNTSPGAAPFVFMENKADFKMSMKGAGSDFEMDNDAWEYGVKAVGEAGYGRFTDAVLLTLN
jgi:hypothetical protein